MIKTMSQHKRRPINNAVLKYKTVIVFIVLVLVLSIISWILYQLLMQLNLKCFVSEPIDVVYTWVNGSDPKFIENYHRYLKINSTITLDHYNRRYSDKYELKYSLRSLEKYAPWINHVYIVTNGQIPHWLDLESEKVTLITHEQIFLDSFDLPTFSSSAIESHLHRIPGLSERFIYFNDDWFVDGPIFEDDFVLPSSGFLIYLAWALPHCNDYCPWVFVADGQCDLACNNLNCQMDGGDCGNNTKKSYPSVKSPRQSYYKKQMALKARNKSKPKYLNATIDFYSESLKHTNRIYNLKYGFKPRYVAAHAPIMIDKRIMEELQNTFEKEFKITSRNRVRNVDDMQFAFSYYYYLMSEMRNLSITEIFDMFDTDFSGTWSDGEIRTVLVQLYDVPLKHDAFDKFASLLSNCSSHSVYANSLIWNIEPKFQAVSKALVTKCSSLSTVLNEKFGVQNKYKHKIIDNSPTSPVHFMMLRSNLSDVFQQLDTVRRHTKKFICLNDDMDETKEEENEVIRQKLNDFYLALFPNLSQFELPTGTRNQFLYLDELNQWKDYHFKLKVCSYVCFFVLCYILCCNLIWRRRFCKFCINKLFR